MKKSITGTKAAPGKPVIVTGSSGFIGQHLCAALAESSFEVVGVDRRLARAGFREVQADITRLPEVKKIARSVSTDLVVHLAAEAEVVTPWGDVPSLLSSNLQGTWNVLTALKPSICVFASTCSIYGNTSKDTSQPRWSTARPLGLYGVSKSVGEILLRDWAHENGTTAILLRLGNIIGVRCRGLIAYLVKHAKEHPDGSVPAQLRGGGRLVRDYTPVSLVVQIMRAAVEKSWEPGRAHIFNVSTARGLTNRQVAEITQRTVRREGYDLRFEWNNPVPQGEANKVIQNNRALVEEFDVKIPGPREVEDCIKESVLDHLRDGHA